MKKNPKTILVIDDDAGMLRLLEKRLSADGYAVLKALNGQSGFEKARNQTPDLIILDVLMPDMNGGEVAKKLKEDPVTQDIPIVFLTITLSKKDKKQMEIDGALYPAVAKPLHNPELLSIVRKQLRKVKKDN